VEDSLKMCPLCGGNAAISFWLEEDVYSYAAGRIRCSECFVTLQRRLEIQFNTEKNPGETFMDLEKELKTTWNSRIMEVANV